MGDRYARALLLEVDCIDRKIPRTLPQTKNLALKYWAYRFLENKEYY